MPEPQISAHGNPLRVALYFHASGATGKDQSPDVQLDQLREYAAARGLTVSGEYIDRAGHGSRQSRPALKRLLDHAGRNQFDAVLVWNLSGFARSLKHLIVTLADLHREGVGFISQADDLDLTIPSASSVFQLIAAMVLLDRAILRENVRTGLRHARARGKRLGRPQKGVDAARILELRGKGVSWRSIAEEVDSGIGTLYRAVRRSKIVCAGI